MIKCEFIFCVYNNNQECILDTISLSCLGYCDDIILPDFPESFLKQHKQKLLNKFAEVYAEWDKRDNER